MNETFPISLSNESGDILLHTGVNDEGIKKGTGNIIAQAEGKGDVKLFADQGNVHVWAAGVTDTNSVILETGSRGGMKDDSVIDPLEPSGKNPASARLALNTKSLSGFSVDQVDLKVGDKWDDSSNDGITIKKGKSILIKCGQSSIEMKDNGDITIKGKNIVIDGKSGRGNVDIKGTKVTADALSELGLKGMNIKLDASVNGQVQAGMLDLKGKGIAKLGAALTQVG